MNWEMRLCDLDINVYSCLDELEKISFSLDNLRRVVTLLKSYRVKKPKFSGSIAGSIMQIKGIPLKKGQVKGQILFRGNPLRAMSGALPVDGQQIKNLNPEEKEVFSRLIFAHEGLERKAILARKWPVRPNFFEGHTDPGVILREHNMLTTLPGKYDKVKKAFLACREDEARILRRALPNYQHGYSPRVSRHNIDNIIKKIEGPEGYKYFRGSV